MSQGEGLVHIHSVHNMISEGVESEPRSSDALLKELRNGGKSALGVKL